MYCHLQVHTYVLTYIRFYMYLYVYILVTASACAFTRAIKNIIFTPFNSFMALIIFCKNFVKFFNRFLFGEKFAQRHGAQHPLALVSRWRVMRCVGRWQAGYTRCGCRSEWPLVANRVPADCHFC